jgi:hypothetical protein
MVQHACTCFSRPACWGGQKSRLPPEGRKSHLQRTKGLVQKTGVGSHWCRSPQDVEHHSAGSLGLHGLGVILQPFPQAYTCTGPSPFLSMGWKPRLASHRALTLSIKYSNSDRKAAEATYVPR